MTSSSDKKFPSGREKNDKQFVMEISIESTVNFARHAIKCYELMVRVMVGGRYLDVNHYPDLCYS